MASRPAVHLKRRGKIGCQLPEHQVRRWTATPRMVTCVPCKGSVLIADAEIEERIQPRVR